MTLSLEDKRAYDIVRRLFKNDYGEPFEMTHGQIELFRAIYEKQYPRIQFDCYTQYGKSDVVSMAVLLRVATFQEKWIILGATKDKAGIIMSKLIKHIFENDYTLAKFHIEDDESIENIRRNRARDNITFRVDDKGGIGQVITLSADARRKSADAGDILIGHGAQNLIEDDAALIPDPIHGKALRMLGGHASHDSFLLKITNSFGRNHAYRSAVDSDNPFGTKPKDDLIVPENPTFHRIVIDYLQGLKEGRLTQEFITEMRQALDPVMFGILYECIYPPADMIEDGGWMPFLTEDQVKAAEDRAAGIQSAGKKRLALDGAEGTNWNSFVVRTDNLMRVKKKTLEPDPMKTADDFAAELRDETVEPEYSWIDASGGSGIYSRAHQLGLKTNSFKGGEKPTEKTKEEKEKDPNEYYNLRAECFWKMRDWILKGGALEPHKDWQQMTKMRYRTTSEKKIQIMPKEEMRARGLLQQSESTDSPDAGSMTFAPVKKKVYTGASDALKTFYPEVGL